MKDLVAKEFYIAEYGDLGSVVAVKVSGYVDERNNLGFHKYNGLWRSSDLSTGLSFLTGFGSLKECRKNTYHIYQYVIPTFKRNPTVNMQRGRRALEEVSA